MAAPQVTEIIQKHPSKILVYFDQPLDEDVLFASTCFSINYGKVPISGASYYGTSSILLIIDRELTFRDKAELNYQPPEDLASAIRSPVADGASNIVLRRNAVRAFFKVPIKNMLPVDESSWMAHSNLGGGKVFTPDPDDPTQGDIPSVDLCGDGSIIIGAPPSGDGEEGEDGGVAPTLSGSTRSGRVDYRNYPNATRPSPRTATPDDFILAYGLKEAIQLSNIDDADAIQPNDTKIWMAIEDATALIDNYIEQAGRGGKLLISSSRRRTALIIARYYLDTVRRREDVKNDYERAIVELDKSRSLQDVERPQLPWWADPCNPHSGVRSHRIPQYYNGVSGKGLDGYWVDSAADHAEDYRTGGVNSQNNNDLTNSGAGGSAPREPQQPTDSGGSGAGGTTE